MYMYMYILFVCILKRRQGSNQVEMRLLLLLAVDAAPAAARSLDKINIYIGFTRRWLQDTSKRKLADYLIFFAPPPLMFPRVYPRLTR